MLNSIEIGQRIKNRLKELDMKQKELNEGTNISHSAMSNYTTGARIPAAEELYKISKCLNVTIEWLLTGTESTNVTLQTLTEDEGELLMLFNQLPQREQIKVIGALEEKVQQYKIQIQINMSEKTS